jgi:hypothetical protein
MGMGEPVGLESYQSTGSGQSALNRQDSATHHTGTLVLHYHIGIGACRAFSVRKITSKNKNLG